MTNRKRLASPRTAVVIAAVGALLLSGCSGSAQANWSGGAPSASGAPVTGSSGPATPAGKITILPDATTGVSPSQPVTVSADSGATITEVSLTHGSKKVGGDLSSDGHTWTSTGPLAFDTKYTLKVTSTGSATPSTTTTFTTLKPKKTVKAHLIANSLTALNSGSTYGVGQPLMVHFASSIPKSSRAAVEKALTVTSSPSVEGRWHWINSYQLDYRGEKYWATGTTLSIKANLLGVSLGSGVYGANNTSATIHIGDSHVLIADNKTHHMKLYINGTMTKDIPVSMGMGGSTHGANGQLVNYWTRSGPHIVINKSPTTTMSSASYGVTDPKSPFYYAPETVKDTVRISYSGEFVHLRDWTVGDIGHRNSSHGCINVGIQYAPYLYKLLRTGDIVDVINTPVKISFDNTQADWEVPWKDWT
jgi:lipoprotein-anchoring transpeptidase ErfK/SrfK